MKKGWLRSRLVTWLAILLAVVSVPVIPLQKAQAASGMSFITLSWNTSKQSWQEGNPGSYNEGDFVKNIVEITNGSKSQVTLSELDLRFSFFDGSGAIGVDYAKNFRWSNVAVAAGSNTTTTGWNPFVPSKRNIPWTGTIGGVPAGGENQYAPYADHYWGITPADLTNALIIPASTTLSIYFETHLAYTFVWNNGKENSLPSDLDGVVGSTTHITRTGPGGWTAKYKGAGFFPGSKLHGYLESGVTGEKTLSVPAISQLNGSISGAKFNSWTGSGGSGVGGWEITATTTVDELNISVATTTASSSGAYSFNNLPYANFTVTETAQNNWFASSATSLPASPSSSKPAVTGVNFYNHQRMNPAFSNLASPSITFGTSAATLGGNIGPATPTGTYPGGNVIVTINGVSKPAGIYSENGSFTCSFDTSAFTPGTYPVSYNYPGDSNFNPAGPVSGNLTVNDRAPVPNFSFAPDFPVEGYRIKLTDSSYDPDVPDHIVSWRWSFFNEGSNTTANSTLRQPFIIPSNEGKIDVTLTVTDMYGLSGSTIKTITVVNAAPVVSALNTEVFPGDNATVFGRFIDPGWTDNHTLSFSINGTAGGVNGSWYEDHFALMGTGVFTGVTTSPIASNVTGTMTVTDTADPTSSSTSSFSIDVIPRDPNNREPNGTVSAATKVAADGRYLSFIRTPGDVDVYEITSDNGSALASGSEVLVGLTNLPADYDLILVEATPKVGNIAGGTISGGTISGGTISGGTISGGTISGGTISAGQGAGGTISGGTISSGGSSGGTISGTATSGGTISGGTISGGTISGGTISGGTISGGTISNLLSTGGTISGGTISGGTISGLLTSGGTISGGTISGGTISGGTISGGTISGGTISGGTISGGTISGGTISGGTISGTLSPDGKTLTGASVSGGTISGGTISGGTISGGTISGGTISGGTISAARIGGGTISGGTISGGTISSLEQYPLSQMGFTGVGAGALTNLGGNDISFAELGVSLSMDSLGTLDGYDTKVVRYSANHGTVDENCLTSVDYGARLFAVVVGANEAFSADKPYTLQVETSKPIDIAAFLKDNQITYPAPVNNWQNVNHDPVIYTTTPKSLFVTQPERMIARYGTDNWTAVSTNLAGLAQRPDVLGDIVALPISIYQRWDQDYSSIDATNNVNGAIRTFVLNYLSQHPTIKNVVFVGNDDIIPFGRVPDETTLGNERQYLLSSFLKPGSPEFFSILDGFILTDDYYVDAAPTPWNGGNLFLPDVAVARLVEKPSDIIADIQAFAASNGVLAPKTGLVSGYDFFVDAAAAVSSHLMAAGVTTDNTSLVSSNWTAQDLRNAFFGAGHGFNAINAHYTSYAAISAAGFASGNFTDVLTSSEAVNLAANSDDQTRGIIFSMGCHSGLSVPDEAADNSTTLGTPFNPQIDFPQAYRRAIYVANTGYGYGDDQGLGGSEHLMEIFTKKLLQSGTVSAGDALRAAKQRYILGLSTVSAYEAKAALEFTFYGLPQYKIIAPKPLPADVLDSPDGSLTLTVGDNVTTYAYNNVDTASGSYWTADGDSQATPYRPILPRVVFPIVPDSNPVHGAVWTGGNFTALSGTNPVITVPTNEWEQDQSEIQNLSSTWWPADLARVNTANISGSLVQSLVVIPAQFKPDSTTGGNVTGTLRTFGGLNFTLVRSSSADWQPPSIEKVDIWPLSGTSINMTVGASDPSDISRIVIVGLLGDGTVVKAVDDNSASPLKTSGNFTYTVPFTVGERFVVQVVDGAGNVAVYTGKGSGITLIGVDATSDPAFTPGVSSNFTATISGFDSLVKPVFYWWDFGDGQSTTGLATSGTLRVQHAYNWGAAQRVAVAKILDADGGVGLDSTSIPIRKLNSSTALTASSSSLTQGTAVTLTAAVSANATGFHGNPTGMPVPTGMVTFSSNISGVIGTAVVTNGVASLDVTSLPPGLNGISASYGGDGYFNPSIGTGVAITSPYVFVGFLSPVAGSQYNLGRTIPIKFRVTDSSGNPVPTAIAQVWATLNNGGDRNYAHYYGNATYSSGQYQYNLDTTRITGTKAGDQLTFWVYLDDGTWHTGDYVYLK